MEHLLTSYKWKAKYTPDDGDLIERFYVPVLQCAVRYDRTSAYFNARVLVEAIAGVEGLVRNRGKMRLILSCQLKQEEVDAILKGEQMRAERKLEEIFDSKFSIEQEMIADIHGRDGLELLSWMIEHGYLEIKIGYPKDRKTGKLLANCGIFHDKTGIVKDRREDILAFSGSLNETLAGWKSLNYDTIHVHRSWMEKEHVDEDLEDFEAFWSNTHQSALVIPLAESVKQKLLQFLPRNDDLPVLLREEELPSPDQIDEEPDLVSEYDRVWEFIRQGAFKEPGGQWLGEATAAVTPWPHQIDAFRKMYEKWPPRLLIADEVGLGKTIQAGLLIRQAWLEQKARRILILAPKAVLEQWQLELREKFNLVVPIYDGTALKYPQSPGREGPVKINVAADEWYKQPIVIASSQLMRRKERARQLLEDAGPWDLVFLDEAHHARRKGGMNQKADLKGSPNLLLGLFRKLAKKTAGLVLLTATPMQVNPLEVWDLLDLLHLPESWTARNFLEFYEITSHPNPVKEKLELAVSMFQEMVQKYGELDLQTAIALEENGNKFRAKKILRMVQNGTATNRDTMDASERRYALKLMRQLSPCRKLISRHTRELLRKYKREGKIEANIATRAVGDCLIPLSEAESRLYAEMEKYISETYNRASQKERNAIGFVLTIYRRRLSSSFYALTSTLSKHYQALENSRQITADEEDLPEDELQDEQLAEDEASKLEKEALKAQEKEEIRLLLESCRKLPLDTKAKYLLKEIEKLQSDGYKQIIIFTQYTDTLDFLRKVLRDSGLKLLCFSGRGGERWFNGSWEKISRDQAKESFRSGDAEILLCTDAAAEGLNFQFCGAVINYDMPWNPMKVEQRIGRIDRLGQKYAQIKIINMMYANTVETDIYLALKARISLFSEFVGKLQPILSRLPSLMGDRLIKNMPAQNFMTEIDGQLNEADNGFDLNEINSELEFIKPDPAPYNLHYLEKVLTNRELLPPEYEFRKLASGKDYELNIRGRREGVRITLDKDYYSDHSETVELWSPGSPVFPWEKKAK